jgi:hypothetical protein
MAPTAQVQEWRDVRSTRPDLLHDAATHSGDAVAARKTEAALDLGMQPVEI